MGFRVGIILGLMCGVALPAVRHAQAQGQLSGDGFLFGPPAADLRLHGGFVRATAGSDVFDEVRERLTLDRGDFDAVNVGADIGIRLTSRLDLVLGGSYASRSAQSEHRDWLENGNPIAQTTEFQRAPLTASVRAYLAPRGERIGSYAWVPTSFAPYVGAGGGAMWYRFRQFGDFVINEHLPEPPIVTLDLRSSGWTSAAHAFAGVDLSVTTRVALFGEARYLWSRAELDQSGFGGFQPIDLSGLSANIGLSLRL